MLAGQQWEVSLAESRFLLFPQLHMLPSFSVLMACLTPFLPSQHQRRLLHTDVAHGLRVGMSEEAKEARQAANRAIHALPVRADASVWLQCGLSVGAVWVDSRRGV